MPDRIHWIDTARGLGLMLVFIGHLHPPYVSTWIYTFHMPLFFFLSGLVFTAHPFRTFYQKKISRLVVPYFSLGLVIYFFYACIYAFEQRGFADYWTMLINLISQKAFWTIWFLAALLFGELIVWVVLNLTKFWNKTAFALSLIIMSGAFFYYRNGGTTLYWCFDVACVAQFFILSGYLFKLNFSKIERFSSRNSVVLLLLLLSLNIISGFLCIRLSGSQLDMSVGLYGNELLSVVSALSGIGFIILLCQNLSSNFLSYLGRNTMVFFAWHSRIIIVACGMVYEAIDLFQGESLSSNILYVLTTLILILAVLYPVTEGIKRTRYSRYFGL